MPHHLSRREFTLDAVLAILSGVVITVTTTGCGSTTPASPSAAPSPTPTPTATSSDVNGVIGLNHGHIAVVTAAQMTAGSAVVLNIQGQADHPHTVELSQAEIGQIAARTRVQKLSSTDQLHQHTVTFN